MSTDDPTQRAGRFPQLDGVRWDGVSGHVESYFLKLNDPQTPGRAVWVKYTILVPVGRPEQAVAEVWGVRFDPRANHGGKLTFEASSCRLSRDQLDLQIGPGTLNPGHCTGHVGTGGGALSWDFRFTCDGPAMYALAHPWMYKGGFPRGKLYTPAPMMHVHGMLQFGDEVWTLEDWPGALGHNWGEAHNPRYHWAQCNHFVGDSAVFEAFSGKIPVGPFLSPWLTGARLRFRGQEWAFDRLTGLLKPNVAIASGRWGFVARQGPHRLSVAVTGQPEGFVGLQYINPDGSLRHCLNTKVADCELLLERRERGQWCEVAVLRADRSCAYEILTEQFDHGIEIVA